MKCKKFYKDMDKYRAYRNAQKQRYFHGRDYSDGTRRPWTEEEIRIVMEHTMTDTEIAQQIRRSVNAVQVKRARMKGKAA